VSDRLVSVAISAILLLLLHLFSSFLRSLLKCICALHPMAYRSMRATIMRQEPSYCGPRHSRDSERERRRRRMRESCE
jgi:hypothetical protein